MTSGKGVAVLAGAGIGSLLTYMLTNPSAAKAAPAPEGVDPDVWNAIISIIESIQEQNARLETALSQVASLVGGSGYALVNPASFTTPNVICPMAAQGYQVPRKLVPWDKEFIVKALSTNAGLIYVANNEVDAAIVTNAYPMLPNEAVGLKIAASDEVWVSAQFAGEGVSCIVEQG